VCHQCICQSFGVLRKAYLLLFLKYKKLSMKYGTYMYNSKHVNLVKNVEFVFKKAGSAGFWTSQSPLGLYLQKQRGNTIELKNCLLRDCEFCIAIFHLNNTKNVWFCTFFKGKSAAECLPSERIFIESPVGSGSWKTVTHRGIIVKLYIAFCHIFEITWLMLKKDFYFV